ncbi:MBL fold metallo-hydrolase [Nesterenkonia sphaerica]|nr:MBL fold metallo-hydrolase [Nesterenkonia sphaerica]
MTTPTPLPASVQVVTCDNPSPMTLEGTHTYLVGDPAADSVVVVDPGPEGHPEHVRRIMQVAAGRAVAEILVTHRHSDHLGAAKLLSSVTGAEVRGMDPGVCLSGGEGTVLPLRDREQITSSGTPLTVLHTPGHTSDSVCFWLPEAEAMLTGDTLLGRGTTMLDYPDGTLTDYLDSLQRLAGYDTTMLLPAHGPAHRRLGPVVQAYQNHRLERLDQARALLEEHGALSAKQLGQLMYRDRTGLNPSVITRIAAAQLDHLGQ